MKRLILISISILIALSINAQNYKSLEFKQSNNGRYSIVPTIIQSKGEGKMGRAFLTDQEYVNNLIYGIIEKALSKEKLEKLHPRSFFMINFNKVGEIIYCQFSVDENDLNVITEEDFNIIYNKIIMIKIDTLKVKIVSGNYPSTEGPFDYAQIVGSLVPVKYRK
jgi:hypothetical protein